MRAEKRAVAGNSVLAAVAITALKVVVGISTGSLGILSEALHSALDLVAAIITLMSVRVSDKPADADHQYGHGKVENFSAFLETGLLLVTHHLPDIVPEIERVLLLKDGRVFRDGAKEDVLTAPILSELFNLRVDLVHRDGYFHLI